MNDNTLKIVVAMLCLTVLELYNLYNGHNGQVLTIIVALLVGLAGYSFKGVFANEKSVVKNKMSNLFK